MSRREWTLYLSLKHKHDTLPDVRKKYAREKREKRMARKEIKANQENIGWKI